MGIHRLNQPYSNADAAAVDAEPVPGYKHQYPSSNQKPNGNFELSYLPHSVNPAMLLRYTFSMKEIVEHHDEYSIISACPPVLLPGDLSVSVVIKHVPMASDTTSQTISHTEVGENSVYTLYLPCLTPPEPTAGATDGPWSRDVTAEDIGDVQHDRTWTMTRLTDVPLPRLLHCTATVVVSREIRADRQYIDGRIRVPLNERHGVILVEPSNKMLVRMDHDYSIHATFKTSADPGPLADVETAVSLPAGAPATEGVLVVDALRQARRGRPPAEANRPAAVETSNCKVVLDDTRRCGDVTLVPDMAQSYPTKRGHIIASSHGVAVLWCYGEPVQIKACLSIPSAARHAETAQSGRVARQAWGDLLKAIPGRAIGPAEVVALGTVAPPVAPVCPDALLAQTDSANTVLTAMRCQIAHGRRRTAHTGMFGVLDTDLPMVPPKPVVVTAPAPPVKMVDGVPVKRKRGRPRLSDEEKERRRLMRMAQSGAWL